MAFSDALKFVAAVAEAPRNLPHAHRCLFTEIAARWDPETELSGPHSYQSLCRALNIHGRQGQPAKSFTKNQIRHYLSMLEASGLIHTVDNLVFRVPALESVTPTSGGL